MASLPKVSGGAHYQRATKDDAETRAHLEAYIAAFIDTKQEFIREFEEAGIEAWLNEEKER